jgi:hypothetical protein
MNRTITFGQRAAQDWDALAEEEEVEASDELREGWRAYAYEQADTERERCADLVGR